MTQSNFNSQEAIDAIEALESAPAEPQEAVKTPVDTVREDRADMDKYDSFLRKAVEGRLEDDDIPEAMRRMFSRSVVGQAPFMHTFSIFENKVEITFQEPKAADMLQYNKLSEKIAGLDMEGSNALVMLYFLKTIAFVDDPNSSINNEVALSQEDLASLKDLTPEETSFKLQELMFEKFTIGNTLYRMLSVLWMMFSYAWRYLIDNTLPRTF